MLDWNRTALAAFTVVAAILAGGCERDTSGLRPVPPNTDPLVFGDALGDGIDFQAFAGSKVDAVTVDASERFSGTASFRIEVPAPGDPLGGYAGGALTTSLARDLSGYNALTFYAKASKASTFDVVGLGNDNTGESLYEASRSAIPLTTTWNRIVVPIPLPAKLDSEDGLCFFAEGAEGGEGNRVWFDDIRFEQAPGIGNPRPSLLSRIVTSFVGSTVGISGTRVTFDVEGSDVVIEHQSHYFDYTSSNEDVARIENGDIVVVGGGTARITAHLGEVEAVGMVTVNAMGVPPEPAPSPAHPAGDVISLFSNAYPGVAVDTWSAPWDQADVSDLRIDGDDVKGYANVSFAGIEFAGNPVDASSMTHFHIDVWIPNSTSFKVKLVDFGDDGIFGGAPDSEDELTFTPSTVPAFVPGSWASLDVPLEDFARLAVRGHLAQLILSGASIIFVDNVYFHR